MSADAPDVPDVPGRRKSSPSLRAGFWVLLCVAAWLRHTHLEELNAHYVLFHHPVVDASEYHEEAKALAAGTWHHQVPIHGILYPLVLGQVYRVTEGDALQVRQVALLLAIVTWILVFFLGRELVGDLGARFAALLLAYHEPALYFDSELYAEGLTVFLLVLVVFVAWRALRSARLSMALLLGAVTGLSALARSNLILLVPVAIVGMAFFPRPVPARRRRFARVLLCTLGALVLIAPFTYWNHRASSEFVLLQARSGHNLYMANHPDARAGIPHIRPGPMFETFRRRPAVEAGLRGPNAESRFYQDLFWNHVRENPGAFARGLLAKGWASLAAVEVPSSYDPALQERFSWVARSPFFLPFVYLLPFALFGLLFFRGKREARLALTAVLLVVWASLILGFAAGRYRYQAAAIVCLFAGHGLVRCTQLLRPCELRQGGRGRMAAFFLLGTLVLACITPRFREERKRFAAEGDQFLAYGYFARFQETGSVQDLERARKAARAAIEGDPSLPLAHYTLGVLSEFDERGGRFRSREGALRAFQHYDRALEVWPLYPEAQENRGRLFLLLQRYEDALAAYEAAVAIQPGRYAAWDAIGKLAERLGKPERARAAYERRDREIERIGHK